MEDAKKQDRLTLWCRPNELRRATGGHPADSSVSEVMVTTLRRMRAAVRQHDYDKSDPKNWVQTGEIAGEEGLRSTLAECRESGSMRRVYLDRDVAETLATAAPRFKRDLDAAVAVSAEREADRLRRAETRRVDRAAARIDAIAA